MNSSKLYFKKDCDLSLIQSKKVGVIGFGNQGRAQALNLIDNNIDVLVGLRDKSKTIFELEKNNIPYSTIEDVVSKVDVIVVLISDKSIKNCFYNNILKYLKQSQTIIFSHGYNIHYKLIDVPKNVNVGMVAPSGGGAVVRSKFLQGSGVPGLIAVHNDCTSTTLELIKSYGLAIGCANVCLFTSTFKEETETDLYGEQALLTGGLPMMIDKSLKVLLEAGYSPLSAWFVCYYEIKMIVDLFHEKGFDYLYNAISDTARYGGLKSGDYLIDDDYENKLKNILKNIQNGNFVKDLKDNVDTLKYKSSLDTKHSDEISKIMNVLFEKTNKGK